MSEPEELPKSIADIPIPPRTQRTVWVNEDAKPYSPNLVKGAAFVCIDCGFTCYDNGLMWMHQTERNWRRHTFSWRRWLSLKNPKIRPPESLPADFSKIAEESNFQGWREERLRKYRDSGR